MKKNILTVAALVAFAGMQAQIQTNNGTVNGITNSNVLLDGSSAFSKEAGAQPNVGKGLIIPSVDLVNFEFDLSLADGFTFPTYFDGMIVYNNATGNTLTTGNRPSSSLAVTPGYYYFSNPNGAANGNITGGQWKAIGGTASGGDNLGNHSATQNLALNDFELRLRGGSDNNQSLVYNSTVNGPRLYGASGGYLGTSNGTNALTWDSNGNLASPGTINAGNKVLVTPGLSSESGYISLYKTSGQRLGYIGSNPDFMAYIADQGNSHYFNKIINVEGKIQLVGNGNASGSSGYMAIYDSPNGTRVGYIGSDITNMNYIAEKGIHTFNKQISLGGKILLNEGTSSEAGYMSIIDSPAGTRVGFIGSNMTNMNYVAEKGIHAFNRQISVESKAFLNAGASNESGNLTIYDSSGGTQVGSVGGGDLVNMNYIASKSNAIHRFNKLVSVNDKITINPGNTGEAGYMSIFDASGGTRIGFIGNDINNMNYVAEKGSHNFNKSVNVGGKVILNTGAASEAGYISIIDSPAGTRVGYIGSDMNNMNYVAEKGGHNFNKSINVGGKVLLNPGAAGEAGYLSIIDSPAGTRVGFIGSDMNNMNYVAEKGAHNFNKLVNVGGKVLLSPGAAGESGYLSIIDSPSGTRVGYIGNGMVNMNYVAEKAGAVHNFNTTIQTPRVQGPSDRRFKKDITPIYNATEKLNQLNGYTYTWKDKKEFPGQTLGEGKDMGVIAQEVEKVFPDAVQTNKDGYKSVNYTALIPVLIEALKESNKKIQALEDRLDATGKGQPATTPQRKDFPAAESLQVPPAGKF